MKNKMKRPASEKLDRGLIHRVEAIRLLRSPRFFSLFLDDVMSAGLVGEQKNALMVFIVAASRLLARPVNMFIKGPSSSGKNFLANTALRFIPARGVEKISSTSATAWNYLGKNLEHKIVYIQEENKAAGNIHPARLIISEREIVRVVSVRVGKTFKTERQVTKGPIACISTTTKAQLQVDDETRHISIWTDDSPEQTQRIVEARLNPRDNIARERLKDWHAVQNLLEERAKLPIEFGEWRNGLSDSIWVGDVRVRRYFEAFMEICRTVCLIRSFLRDEDSILRQGKLTVRFSDFCVASMICDSAFSDSLSHGDTGRDDADLHAAILKISNRNRGKGASVEELAKELGISSHQAYARLRKATEAETVQRSNKPERGNRKLYRVTEPIRMIPDPKEVFKKLPIKSVKFTHPLTGTEVNFRK